MVERLVENVKAAFRELAEGEDWDLAGKVISDWHDLDRWYDPSMFPIPPFSGAQHSALQCLIRDAIAAARQPTTDRDESLIRFMEHFITKIEPFYERKHGKVPPEQGGSWELLAFVQNELSKLPATDSVAEKARRAAIKIYFHTYPRSAMQKDWYDPGVEKIIIAEFTAESQGGGENEG